MHCINDARYLPEYITLYMLNTLHPIQNKRIIVHILCVRNLSELQLIDIATMEVFNNYKSAKQYNVIYRTNYTFLMFSVVAQNSEVLALHSMSTTLLLKRLNQYCMP